MNSIIKYKYYLATFFFTGILVYFPTFFNGFAWDDIRLLLQNPQIHQVNFSIFFDNIYNTEYMYRQISPLYFSALYTLFGDKAAGYHVLQLLQHIIATSLIFFFFVRFFNKSIAFILSSFFLIHPINAETVVWISSTQTIQYTIFGITGLLIGMKKELTNRRILFSTIFLFLSLITYEMALLYSGLLILYHYLHKTTQLKKLIVPLFIIFVFYLGLRYIGNSFNFYAHTEINLPMKHTFIERLYTMPSIISYYFVTLLFPLKLQVWQHWVYTSPSLLHVIFPALIIQIVCVLFVIYIISTKQKERSVLLFFSIWFLAGMLPLLHFFPLHMTVADRWFYFPFIGLLGIIGFLAEKYWGEILKYKTLVLAVIILVMTFYAIRTFIRTFDWKNNFVLYSHDIQYQPDNIYLNYEMGGYYYEREQYDKALPYLKKVLAQEPMHNYIMLEIAESYQGLGEKEKSIYYYKKTIEAYRFPTFDEYHDPYLNITILLMDVGRPNEVVEIITDKIVESSLNKISLLYYRANAYRQLKKYDLALQDAEFLYKNVNNLKSDKLYKEIQKELEQADK